MPKRIQRQRVKGWRMPENTVYVGRPTQWGNPVAVGDGHIWKAGSLSGMADTPRQACVYFFIATNYEEIRKRRGENLWHLIWVPDHDYIRRHLKGRDLACWCPLDQPCHADVLLEIANKDTP